MITSQKLKVLKSKVKNKIQKTKYEEVNTRHRGASFFCSPLSTFHFPLSTRRRGVATLPTVLLLGAMALVVAVSMTALSFTELFISQGSAQSSRAHFYAESGARDALIKVARDKTYTCITGAPNYCYSIDFSTQGCTTGNDCARVQVVDVDATHKTIISKGIMKASSRTLQVAVTLDAYGAITAATWSELMN